jgi:rubredoxin
MIQKALFTCPECGYKKEAVMPTDTCQHFYQCSNCKKIISPKKGDCCVFCSYADKKCPLKQTEN